MIFSRTPHPACPFIAGPKIDNTRCFVGRKDELRRLAGWMSGSQPVSVNVVGGRLSGKSSLLQQFARTYAQRVTEPGRFLVVCICLRLAKPKTEAEFYQTLAVALSKLRAVDSASRCALRWLNAPAAARRNSLICWSCCPGMACCRSSAWMSSRSSLTTKTRWARISTTACTA